jgi:prepilin-type N-terminal cleavage/methylation domain-containing protein
MRGQSAEQIRPPGGEARAFTLVEVLAVVLILSIAAAVILPQVCGQSDMDAAAAARTIMGDLLYAQNRAIAMQEYAYVVFNPTAQSYSVYDGTSSGPTTQLYHPINGTSYVMTFGQSGPNNVSSDVALGAVSFNGQSTIAFDETGVPWSYNSGGTLQALNGTGSIQLNSGSYSVTISVAQDTGEITASNGS